MVRTFLENCDDNIYIQIKQGEYYVNRGLAKDLLRMDNDDRLNSEILNISTQIYNAHELGIDLADIVLTI